LDERSARVRIGLFILVGIALLTVFIVVLGKVALMGGTELEVRFQESAGLKTRAPVRIVGMDAGLVRAVELVVSGIPVHDGHPYPIKVRLSLRDQYLPLLRADARITIQPATILGEKVVAIDPGTPAAPPLDLTGPVWGAPTGGIDQAMAQASKLAEKVSAALGDSDLGVKGGNLVDRLTEKVDHFSQRGDALLDELNATLKDARGLMARVQVPVIPQERVDRLLAKAEGALDAANRAIPKLTSDASGVAADARAALTDLRTLLGDLGKQAQPALARVDKLLAALDEGDGLLALLLKDREIYYDLKELVRDLKNHPWKVLWKQ
jgi:phospholipid/cholesterol/gamma-HCH transport system substrate-binding protein